MESTYKQEVQLEEKAKRRKGAKNNKFRFENYVEKLSGIEIKIGEDEIWGQNAEKEIVEENKWYSQSIIESLSYDTSEYYKQDEKNEQKHDTHYNEDELIKTKLSITAFGDSLKYWESEVRYSEFLELVKTLRPYRYSLVHIIDNLGLIVQELTLKLNYCEHPETAEAISFLLGSLAKDTRLELIPFLPLIFESLSGRLENQFTDSSVTGQGGVGFYNAKIIQSVFSCTGTIFFYLSNYILKDLSFYLNAYKKWIYHKNSTIRHFSAESIAYAIKKCKNKDLIKSLDYILIFVKEESELLLSASQTNRGSENDSNSLLKWLCDTFSSILFSFNGCISNQGDVLCRYLLRHISFGLCIENKIEYLLLKPENKLFSETLSNQGVISNYLNSISKSNSICNDNFTSICDSVFRKSFPGLNGLIGDIFANLRLEVVENYNSSSFEKILSYLIEIYYELCSNLKRKMTDVDEINKIELENSVSSVVSALNIISKWICVSSEAVDINTKTLDLNMNRESPNIHKRKLFHLKYAQITTIMLLIPIHEIINSEDIESRLLSQYILGLVNVTTNVTKESFFLRSFNFVDSLVFLDYDEFYGDQFLYFGNLISSYFGSFLRNNRKTKWKWLVVMLDIFSTSSGYTMLIKIMNVISEIIPVFESGHNEGLENFIRVAVKYQRLLLNDKSLNKELYIKVIENMLLFTRKTEEIGFRNSYFADLETKYSILRLCNNFISSLNSCEIIYEEINTVFELLSVVLRQELKSCDSSNHGYSNTVLDLKSNILRIYNVIFGVKLTGEESKNGFSITHVYESLSSMRTFKYFCLLFEILGMSEAVNLEFMLKNISGWTNLRLFERNRVSISHLPRIPIYYNAELVSILEILIRLSGVDNSMAFKDRVMEGELRLLFLYWIASPLQQVRRLSVNLFISCIGDVDTVGKGIMRDLVCGLNLIKELEDSDINIENERSKVRIMQQICDLVFFITSQNQETSLEYDFVLKYLTSSILSQLYVKLSLVWKPCTDMLVKLVKMVIDGASVNEKQSESFSLIDAICSNTCRMIYVNSSKMREYARFKSYEVTESSFTDELTVVEWCCRLLSQVLVSLDKEFLFNSDSKYNCLFYHNLILYWTIQTSYDIEGTREGFHKLKKDKLLLENAKCDAIKVESPFSFLELDLPCTNKDQIQRVNHLLVVLESILDLRMKCENNKVFGYLFSKFCLECVPNLLKINHVDMQLCLVRIICDHSEDGDSLSRYKSMFEILVSGSSEEKKDEVGARSFRNCLLMYPLSADRDDIIRREDRVKVIPVVVRILLSKLGKDKRGSSNSNNVARPSKKGNKALTSNNKRKVIVSYFSELPREEISMLLSVIIEPVVRVGILDAEGEEAVTVGVCNSDQRGLGSQDAVQVEGYLKSFLLDNLIKSEVAGDLERHWLWKEALNNTENPNKFGFAYKNKDLQLTLPIKGAKASDFQLEMWLKPLNMLNSEYKRILMFLNYVENLLDAMPHSLKESSHIIFVILVNVLQLDVVTMKCVCDCEVKEDGAQVCEEELEEDTRAEEEGEVADEIEVERNVLLSRHDKLALSRREVLSVKKRSKLILKTLFSLMTKILLNYPEFSTGWIYLLRPVSPCIVQKFDQSIKLGREQAGSYISSTINLLSSISKKESLFSLYKELFPTVIGDLTGLISEKLVLENMKRTSPRSYGYDCKNSEVMISKVVEMYLNIIFGGSDSLSVLKERIRKSPEVFRSSSNIDLILGDSEPGITESFGETGGLLLRVSKFGLSVIGSSISKIVDSLQKIIYRRGSLSMNKRAEIVTLNELMLLKVFALLEIKNKPGFGYLDDNTGHSADEYCINISKIVLLLVLSCMSKLNLKSENTVNNNIGVFDLVVNLIRSSKLGFVHFEKKESASREDGYEKGLVERIHVLVDKEYAAFGDKSGLVSTSKYAFDFYCLVSDIMSSLLLKTDNLKLREMISEIYLRSELLISGNSDLPSPQFDLKGFVSLVDREYGIKASIDLLVPIYIYSLNVPLGNGRKRSLETRIDVDLQLDVLSKLGSVLFKTVSLAEQEEIELLNVSGRNTYSVLYPLLNQLLYYLSNSGSEDFSVQNVSTKLINRIVTCWCNEIKCISIGARRECEDDAELKVLSVYKLILNLFVPFEEEVLKRSCYSLSRKRAILSVTDTIILGFAPHVDYFSRRFGVPKEYLVRTFHLGLSPIREYFTVEDGEKVNLFEEMAHIQKHKRARALNFLGRFSKFSLNHHNSGVRRRSKSDEEAKDGVVADEDSSLGKGEDRRFLDKYQLGYPLSPYTIKTIGINFCIHSLIQSDSSRETYHLGLGDNSLRSIESFSLYLDWRECIDLTAHLIRLLRLYPQRKSYIIKAICSLLNSFDFQVNSMVVAEVLGGGGDLISDEFLDARDDDRGSGLEERLSEMQANVKRRLLPLLKSVMVDRSYKTRESGVNEGDRNGHGLIRSEVVLIIIRVLRCLPSREFHSELPRLITQLILALKSKDRDVRRSSRSSLKSACKTLGIKYLVWIFKQMSSILTKGYQLPVLIFTVHSILNEIFSVKSLVETVDNKREADLLDGCIETVSKMIVDELNRIADPDRRTVSLETMDTPMTGTVDEGKYIRCPHIMRILSKNVTLEGVNRLYGFLNDLLSGAQGEREESSVMSDSYSQKYLHWLRSLYLQFCIGFLNNAHVSDKRKLEFSLLGLARNVVLDRSIIRNGDLRGLIMHSMSEQVTSLFQDPLNLLQRQNAQVEFGRSSTEEGGRTVNKRDRYYSIQPGAPVGRGTHQVIKHQRGFERKVRSVVLCNSSLYLLNNILKLVNNGNFDSVFGDDGDAGEQSRLVKRNMLQLLILMFSDNSSELASISCRCLVRVLLLNSMESSKQYEFLRMDDFGPLICKISLDIMRKSGISSSGNANNGNITELICSSIKLFVALLIRPKSQEWFNGLFYDESLKKMTPYYTSILKQLHITINDNRLRITSLQLLRQIILYGKDQIKLSSESLGSLYSLVDYILPIVVQYSSSEPRIASIGCNLYVEFLLYYPMSERSQRQRISILLENLAEYPTSEGRRTLLAAIHTLVSRFPVKLLKESYNIMFMCGVTLALSVETEMGPISAIREIVGDVLDMYENENKERVGLINTIFKTLNKVDADNAHFLDVKCGLIVLLRYVFEYYMRKKDVIRLEREIGDIGGVFFSELSGVLDLLLLPYNDDEKTLSLQRLEYETFNLLNLAVSDRDLFQVLNSVWLGGEGVLGKERTDLWKRVWGVLVLNTGETGPDSGFRRGFGIHSAHLWNKSASLKLVTRVLSQSLAAVCGQSGAAHPTHTRAGSGLGFIVDYALSEDAFTSVFEKVVRLQFAPLLEESPWLAPTVAACIQHLLLLSSRIDRRWEAPKRLSHLDSGSVTRRGLEGRSPPECSFYGGGKRGSSEAAGARGAGKRIKILEENQVKEEDWLVYEEESEGEAEKDLSRTAKRRLREQKSALVDADDNTDEMIDAYLLDRMTEEGSGDCGAETRQYPELDAESGALEGEREVQFQLVRPDVYLWFLDRVSCCCRYYTTKPAAYRARLLLGIKTLNDIVEMLPGLMDVCGGEKISVEDSLSRTIGHSVRALYQCSTMLSRDDLCGNSSNALSTNINSFEWVGAVASLDSLSVVKQACIFAQKAVERWDCVFTQMNRSSAFMGHLSESRRQVMQNRLERKSRLRLEKIRNPEFALRRKQSLRLRNKRNRIRKLRVKVANRRLGLS
ncbi:hypothetical protein FG386_002989 [Cryptosporidium ryanae]|uniref:uncharacterized protein n=1 Tax=Cryptosporidium ryanae TaxID=515981 RepID=UPI00351A2F99|nr:hypothetical protein FG386_002989 [Cryptosporidium ryanae]